MEIDQQIYVAYVTMPFKVTTIVVTLNKMNRLHASDVACHGS